MTERDLYILSDIRRIIQRSLARRPTPVGPADLIWQSLRGETIALADLAKNLAAGREMV
jgi:hypothetical protein